MTTLHQATLLSVLLFFLAACQPEDSAESAATPPSDAVVIGSHHTLTSRILDEEREYRVYLPDSYDSETYLPQAYPVIYVLDGESHFHALSGTVRHMSAGINGNVQIPQAIVVAILNSDRPRDLTPTHSMLGYDGEETDFLANTGGGPRFLEFLAEELAPTIESNYRTLPHRTLIGHSFGGLFALHAVVHSPDTFDAYISIDPSLWWDEQNLVAEAESVFATEQDRQAVVYISMADHPGIEPGEPDVMQDTARAFAASLEESASPGIRSYLQMFDAEDHGSVPHLSHYYGLLRVFDGYKVSLSDVVDRPNGMATHYRDLSERLDSEFLPPEWVVDQFAAYILNALENHDKALELYRLNVSNYPDSPNAHVGLGNALRASGELDAAAVSFERAIALGDAHPSAQAAREGLAEMNAAD